MSGRTPSEAVHNFVDPLRLALDCITTSVLIPSPGGYKPREEPHVVTLGVPVRVRGPQRTLSLELSQRYRIIEADGDLGPWKVQTAGYSYGILNDDQSEYLLYHWHPEGPSSEKRPHLHIAGPARKHHIPTGRVALEDVIRLCLGDLGVTPRRGNWMEILDGTQAAFETWRTWA